MITDMQQHILGRRPSCHFVVHSQLMSSYRVEDGFRWLIVVNPFVSSAKTRTEFFKTKGRLLIQNQGPKTDPCMGIPPSKSLHPEYEPFACTCCLWPVKNDFMQSSNFTLKPYALSFLNNLLCVTESSAFLKSRNNTLTVFPQSIKPLTSLQQLTIQMMHHRVMKNEFNTLDTIQMSD